MKVFSGVTTPFTSNLALKLNINIEKSAVDANYTASSLVTHAAPIINLVHDCDIHDYFTFIYAKKHII